MSRSRYADDYDGDDDPPRARYRCHDRMCGALDCANCHPEMAIRQDNDDEQET
jgi:hypothetical protein